MTRGGGPALDRLADAAADGERLDVVLASWLGEPRAQAQGRLAAGEVTVDGRAVGKSHRLREGERVVVAEPQPPPAPPLAAPVPVRWEDEELLVVAKPAGLVAHRGAGAEGPTLVEALRAMGRPLAEGGDLDRPGIVHRLDRGTSGLLVVAKTDTAREGLAALFSRHDVIREYTVIVEGAPAARRATIEAPIARSPARRTVFAVDPGGRPAVTHYDVQEAFGRASVLVARLETGRTHQVRVHMASIGHPVAGDRAYGAGEPLAEELGLDRPALHARRLAFRHPVTGVEVDVEEPLPADLRSAIDALRGS